MHVHANCQTVSHETRATMRAWTASGARRQRDARRIVPRGVVVV
jgi:hypothetical protein